MDDPVKDEVELAARERLKASFRNTLDLMERMGVPRHVLLEVVQAVLEEEQRRLTPRH